MDFMQVKSGGKTLKIKLNESTISVLGRIFNLRPETIYLIGDETVIMPDASRVWFEDVMSFTVYEVHGDPPVQAPQDSPQDTSAPLLGNRFSYQSQQSSSRRSITPPPGVSGRKPYFPSRPTFTTTKTSGGEPTWRKNVIFSEVVDGKLSAIYQIYLTLTAETATVTKIAEMVSEEVGVRVMLLDSKGLRIMPSEATKGHAFWQPTRKVYAIPVESAGSLEGKRKRSSDQQTSSSEFKEVISELKKMKEDLSKVKDAQEGTESAAQRGTHVTSFLKNVFRCTICFGSTKLPAACCSSCEAIIGCIHCVEQWRDDNQATSEFMCPLCRAEGEYKTVPVIRELQEALVSIDANDLQENGQ